MALEVCDLSGLQENAKVEGEDEIPCDANSSIEQPNRVLNPTQDTIPKDRKPEKL